MLVAQALLADMQVQLVIAPIRSFLLIVTAED